MFLRRSIRPTHRKYGSGASIVTAADSTTTSNLDARADDIYLTLSNPKMSYDLPATSSLITAHVSPDDTLTSLPGEVSRRFRADMPPDIPSKIVS